jgi:hypothetical protein
MFSQNFLKTNGLNESKPLQKKLYIYKVGLMNQTPTKKNTLPE